MHGLSGHYLEAGHNTFLFDRLRLDRNAMCSLGALLPLIKKGSNSDQSTGSLEMLKCH